MDLTAEDGAGPVDGPGFGAEPDEETGERPILRVLISYDYHNVLDMHWADTREFRERVFQEKPPWVDIQELGARELELELGS